MFNICNNEQCMNFSLPLTLGAAQGEAEAGCLVLICLEVGAGSWDKRDILFYNIVFYLS